MIKREEKEIELIVDGIVRDMMSYKNFTYDDAIRRALENCIRSGKLVVPMTVEEIKELFNCKECKGAGWTVGLKQGLRGEPEQEQIQCPKCYQGSVCLPCNEDNLAQAIHAAQTGKKG